MTHVRLAVDSDNLADLDWPVDFVLTYSDLVHDPAAFEAQHAGRQVVYIDRGLGDPEDKATIIDIETGAHHVDDLPGWYDRKAAARHNWLTYYCDRNTLPAVRAVIGGRHMWSWVATLDGRVAISGFVPFRSPDLVQILGASQLGVHIDLSLVLSPSWRPAAPGPHVAAALAKVNEAARDITTAGQALAAARASISQI